MLLQIQNQDISLERQLNERQGIKKVLERSVHNVVELIQSAVKYDVIGHWPISLYVSTSPIFPCLIFSWLWYLLISRLISENQILRGAHAFFPTMLLYINRMLPATPLEMVNRVNGYKDALTLIQYSNVRFGVAEQALRHLTATLEEDLEVLIFAGHDDTMSTVAGWPDLVVHSPDVYLKLVLIVENFFERGVVV